MTPNQNTNISQQNFEKIEKYLSGKMTEREILQFEEQIKKDASFSVLIEEQQLLSNAIEEQALKYKLEDFHEEAISKLVQLKPEKTTQSKGETKTHQPTFTYRKFAIAASFAILIGIGSFLFFNTTNSSQKIFAAHFSPDPGLPTTMGSTNNFSFYDGMVNYKRGEYKTAILKWETLLLEKPNNDTLNYFLGVAYLAKGNQEQAILFLDKNLGNKQSFFNKDALYYSALAKIKNKDIIGAKKILKESNSEKSKKLQAELNNL